ncbi:MAG: hypothetical protein L6R40_004240 [Gallowayella cf. fulva]|nr:MAG: hypothetical protein L6R40_004240 [Xanthomendoza cf. fulva]
MAATPFKRLEDLHWHGSRALGKLSQAKEFDKWAGHRRWSLDRLDYEDTFMTHAEMYVMACEYMLDELKNMAWQRLRLVLITIGTPKPMSAVIGNMISLARYVYQETGKVGEEDEPLRELIVTFAGLYFTKFEGPEFQELIMSSSIGDREFLHDLMMKVMAKVAHLEGNGLSHLTVTQDDNWAIPNIHSVMGIEDFNGFRHLFPVFSLYPTPTSYPNHIDNADQLNEFLSETDALIALILGQVSDCGVMSTVVRRPTYAPFPDLATLPDLGAWRPRRAERIATWLRDLHLSAAGRLSSAFEYHAVNLLLPYLTNINTWAMLWPALIISFCLYLPSSPASSQSQLIPLPFIFVPNYRPSGFFSVA